MPVKTIHLQPGCSLDIDDPDAIVREILAEQATHAVGDPAAAVRAALQSPVDYPPLRDTVFAGDRIVISVGEGIPQATSIVSGVVEELLDAGVEPARIAVLLAATSSLAARIAADSEAAGRDAIQILTHDPADRQQHALLATAASGEAIVLNRLLCDADLVIPIGIARPMRAPASFGMHHAIYPTFSDTQTQEHFRVTTAFESEVHYRNRAREVKEAAWLLGVQFAVQVVPAARGQVLEVQAGLADRVEQTTASLTDAAWDHPIPDRAGLVIAAIGASEEAHSWHDVARGLAVALQAADEGAVIAVCSNLAQRPGPALAHLLDTEDAATAITRIRREKSDDAWAAMQLAEALDRGPVFMFSGLSDDVLEDLRIAPIHNEQELSRLASRCGRVSLLHEAQLLALRA